MSSGAVTVFTVIHQTDSISGLGIICPLMTDGLKFCHIPAGILIRRTFYISVLDIKGCFAAADIQREKHP